MFYGTRHDLIETTASRDLKPILKVSNKRKNTMQYIKIFMLILNVFVEITQRNVVIEKQLVEHIK